MCVREPVTRLPRGSPGAFTHGADPCHSSCPPGSMALCAQARLGRDIPASRSPRDASPEEFPPWEKAGSVLLGSYPGGGVDM